MAPGPPPAREEVRCRHEPLGEGRPSLAARSPDLPLEGSRTSTCLPDLLSMHVSTPSRGSGTAACPAATGVHKILTRRAHGTPYLEARTPYSDDHAACRCWQDAGAIYAGPRTISRTTATPDAMPHSVLPTVFDYCTPAIRGRTTTFTPLLMYTAPPCDYKRRRRAPFKGGWLSLSLSLALSGRSPCFDISHRGHPHS